MLHRRSRRRDAEEIGGSGSAEQCGGKRIGVDDEIVHRYEDGEGAAVEDGSAGAVLNSRFVHGIEGRGRTLYYRHEDAKDVGEGARTPASYNEPVRLNPRTFAWLLRRSFIAAFDDGCLGQAKGAAYSALLSFFPVLTSAAAILVQSHAEFVSRTLQNALSQIVPPGSQELVVQQFRVTGAHPLSLIVVAGLVSLWAASGVIKSLIEGFHAAYRVPRNRGFVHQSWVAMGLVLVAAIPLLGASLLIVFGAQVERAVLKWIQVDPLLNPFAWVVGVG